MECWPICLCSAPFCLALAGPGRAQPSLCSFPLPCFLCRRHLAQCSPLCGALALRPARCCWQGRGRQNKRAAIRALSVFLSFGAFYFKGGALRMLSFTCICRCNCLPNDMLIYVIWKNPWRVSQDWRPRNYQHTMSAIFLRTKTAGSVFAIPSEIAVISARSC